MAMKKKAVTCTYLFLDDTVRQFIICFWSKVQKFFSSIVPILQMPMLVAMFLLFCNVWDKNVVLKTVWNVAFEVDNYARL